MVELDEVVFGLVFDELRGYGRGPPPMLRKEKTNPNKQTPQFQFNKSNSIKE